VAWVCLAAIVVLVLTAMVAAWAEGAEDRDEVRLRAQYVTSVANVGTAILVVVAAAGARLVRTDRRLALATTVVAIGLIGLTLLGLGVLFIGDGIGDLSLRVAQGGEYLPALGLAATSLWLLRSPDGA
jgi:hypothetical protein